MGFETGIEWCDATVNFWRGCRKVGPGCKNCYMFREQKKYGRDPNEIIRSKTTFNDPLKWKKSGKLKLGSRIFTCSFSDFFIEEADLWREEAWDIIYATEEFWYLILTKRAARMYCEAKMLWEKRGKLPKNVLWMITGENQECFDKRMEWLGHLKADFPELLTGVSFEPLLEEIDIRRGMSKRYDGYFELIDWAIVGGESGPGHREFNLDWARRLLSDCRELGIAYFMKQIGGWPDKKTKMSDFPPDLRIREFPKQLLVQGT